MDILVLVCDGFEETEMIAPVDILRRWGANVTICSMTGSKLITGSHNIQLAADCIFDDKLLIEKYDGIILPGGQPNSSSLRDDMRVITLVKFFAARGKLVSAICAAPCVLEKAGLLKGKKATSYPGCIDETKCNYVTDSVAVDGNIITSRGMGTAIDFGLAIVTYFEKSSDKSQDLSKKIMYR